MKEIRLTRGKVALIDDRDLEVVSKFSWSAYQSHKRWGWYAYAYTSPPRKYIFMHRLILGLTEGDGLQVDHINRNGLDNRRRNLRIATPKQNQYNQGVRTHPKTSKYKGVSWNKVQGEWVANIRVNGRKLYLGGYSNEEDAARAYNDGARKHFGEFARPNQIE